MSLSPSATLTKLNDFNEEYPDPQELGLGAIHSNVSPDAADDSNTQCDPSPTRDTTSTVVLSSRSVTLTMSRSGCQGSYHPPYTEALLAKEPSSIDDGGSPIYEQRVGQDVDSTTSRDQRKRPRAPNPSDMVSRPSKRRPGVDDGAPPGEQRGGCTNGETSPGRLSTDNQALTQIGSGFFSNASNMIFRDPIVGSQQIYVQNNLSDDTVFRWLKLHAMHGAEYDSADRDPPPRCHPDTRTTIIQRVQSWPELFQQEKKLLWLQGTAGVGKSATVQTLAEILFKTGRLGASLFFSRTNGRTNPRQIFPTLAYRFAVQDPSYKEYITQLMRTDPESLNKTMSEQFRLLIVDPFTHGKIRSGLEAWVVTLDGLDECGRDPNNRLHSHHVQRDIVRMISVFVQQYPAAPLVWVIASRPEAHLKAVFSEPDVVPSFWEEEVPVNSPEACRDVERYLHKELTKISQNYPDHIRHSPWPTSKQFLEIAHAALGLFIFAEVVIRFIDDPQAGNPIARLKVVLYAISKLQPNENQENPLANLDEMYNVILSEVSSSTLQITKHLLGFLFFLTAKHVRVSDCNLRLIWDILNISEDTGITALRRLHSVLYFPKVKDVGLTRPRFYHTSFRDFLRDKSRSREYFVDEEEIVAKIIQGTARVAQARFSSEPISPLSSSSDEEHEETPDYFVSELLASVFRGDFSQNGVELTFYNTTGWLLGAQLQSLLDNLSVIEVMKRAGRAFNALVDGQKGRSKRELSRRGFISETTVWDIGIDWDTVSLSISELRGFQHVQVENEITGTQEDNSIAQAVRLFFKTTAPNTKATVFGQKGSNCCIIISSGQRGYLDYALTRGLSLVI